MSAGIVTRPFDAFLHLEGAERRLEVGETVPAAELATWGRSVDHLINTGRLALINEVVSGEASIESLIQTVVDRAEELSENAIAKLQDLLPQVLTDDKELFDTIRERADEFVAELAEHGINLLEHSSDEDLLTEVGRRGLSPGADVEAEGDGAKGADGDPGGVGADAPASPPSASNPDTVEKTEPGVDESGLTPESQPATESESDKPAA